MNHNITNAIIKQEDEPSMIFLLIKQGKFEDVDMLLSKEIVSVNETDELNDTVVMKLLKHLQYELVLKYMNKKNWNINHQNNDGNTFAHILVTQDYKTIIDIISKLKKNIEFIPNIKNNLGETILDKSIKCNSIYTTTKILEDKRFNNIDILSFKNFYKTYIKSNQCGKYTRVTNLEIIVDNLEAKKLLPKVKQLIEFVQANYELIKEEVINNDYGFMDEMIDNLINQN